MPSCVLRQARGEQGRAWVAALARGGYGALAAGERVRALGDLVHLALDAPSVRACLDARLDEGLRVRRRKWDDNRVRSRAQHDYFDIGCVPAEHAHAWRVRRQLGARPPGLVESWIKCAR